MRMYWINFKDFRYISANSCENIKLEGPMVSLHKRTYRVKVHIIRNFGEYLRNQCVNKRVIEELSIYDNGTIYLTFNQTERLFEILNSFNNLRRLFFTFFEVEVLNQAIIESITQLLTCSRYLNYCLIDMKTSKMDEPILDKSIERLKEVTLRKKLLDKISFEFSAPHKRKLMMIEKHDQCSEVLIRQLLYNNSSSR